MDPGADPAPDPALSVSDLQGVNQQKIVFMLIVIKKPQNSRNQGFS
jgi:hypothetical protein